MRRGRGRRGRAARGGGGSDAPDAVPRPPAVVSLLNVRRRLPVDELSDAVDPLAEEAAVLVFASLEELTEPLGSLAMLIERARGRQRNLPIRQRARGRRRPERAIGGTPVLLLLLDVVVVVDIAGALAAGAQPVPAAAPDRLAVVVVV